MNIFDERNDNELYLELGDFIKEEDTYYLLAQINDGAIILVDLEENVVYKNKFFSNPSHVYHHFVKHYGKCTIIKSFDANLTFE